ncbi:zinc finger BED-type containing 1 [Chelydra serpentina]|uniref:Zinc finger BED-type containing 1 n=1 Tax=Chelydra serpentina TaxID=8475 RepID=A0A8T1T099_CHESE|nr:zinc finger BED-type containing 1 [Chelydra serpentina]
MEQNSKSLGLLNGKFIFRKLLDGSLDKKTVICSYCKAEFQYHRSTSSLQYHIRAKHAFASGSCATANPLTANESRQPRQSTLTEFQDQTKYNSLTNAVAKWIAMDCRPLNIVNDRGLRDVIQIASSNQRYTLPSQEAVASRRLDLYHEKTTKLELLKNALAVALTGDHWTSLSNHSCLGVTAHLIDAVWTLQLFALMVTHTEERHYAETCAECFLDVAKEWNIQEKVTTTKVTHNMIAAASHLPFEHMACIAHSLQRSVTVALDDGGFENLLAKGRKLAGHFKPKPNPANSAELGIQQAANGQKQEPLVQDISARWNSTLGMVQFLLRNKAALTATLALQKHSLSVPPDFEKLQKLETLLELCRFVTWGEIVWLLFYGFLPYISCYGSLQ